MIVSESVMTSRQISSRKYYLKNKDRIAAYNRVRFQLKKKELTAKSEAWWDFAFCYYCSKKVSTKSIHFDHIIPLSKGGPHSVDNLCVSCAECNMQKHDNPIEKWVKFGQQILAI